LLRVSAALAALGLPLAEQAYAQAPKTIRFIVPFPAGGGADLLVRVLSEQIGRSAGAATVVENRPGAASIVGTEFVSRATPDGGTVLIAANSFIIHPFFKKLNYDPLTSFAPIAWLATSPQVVVVNAASPFRTLLDLIEAAQAKPGELTNASVGPATTQHIAFELFKLRAKIKMIYVPFNGNGPAINELLGRRRPGDGELCRSGGVHKGRTLARSGCGIAGAAGMAAGGADNRRVRLSRL
jgi:tripartite-type tricarboxylate transporter receptor subunit TctC